MYYCCAYLNILELVLLTVLSSFLTALARVLSRDWNAGVFMFSNYSIAVSSSTLFTLSCSLISSLFFYNHSSFSFKFFFFIFFFSLLFSIFFFSSFTPFNFLYNSSISHFSSSMSYSSCLSLSSIISSLYIIFL